MIHFRFNESCIHFYLLLWILLQYYSYIVFKFLMIFYFNFYVYKLKFNIMYAVSFICYNLSPYFFPFSSFQGKFFLSPWTMAFFSPLPPSMLVFSMEFINFLIAHECDHSFRLLLPWAIQSQAFIFSPFGGWQGGSGP